MFLHGQWEVSQFSTSISENFILILPDLVIKVGPCCGSGGESRAAVEADVRHLWRTKSHWTDLSPSTSVFTDSIIPQTLHTYSPTPTLYSLTNLKGR